MMIYKLTHQVNIIYFIYSKQVGEVMIIKKWLDLLAS